MNAFKSQQHRWAKGSIQTFLKLMPQILQSDQPFHVKAEAFFHLSANFNYPLMCVLSVLMAPSMVIRYNMGWYEMLLIDVPLFLAATASVANFYMVCQRELYPHTWTERLKYLPILMSIGIGLAVNNTKAVMEAVFHKPSEFKRTPKYRIEGGSGEWMGKNYRQAVAIQPIIELSLGLYFTGHAVLRAGQRHLRHRAVPDAVPGRLPLYRPALDRAAVRRRPRLQAGRQQARLSTARHGDRGGGGVIHPDATLVTERLALRRFTVADLDLLDALGRDPRVMRYLGGVKDRAKTEAMLRVRILEYYDQHPGFGIWATLERASGQCVGFHVLNHIQGESDIQVGYALFPDAWGKGYATEMTRALLRYGFAERHVPHIVAIANLDNLASHRVLLKAGLRRHGERQLSHEAYAAQGPLAWFEADSAAWLAAHR